MAQTFRWGGRSWGPGDLKAFRAWLGKRGATFDGFAVNHPELVGRVFPGYYDQALASPRANPRALDAALTSRALGAIAPERSAIQAERSAAMKSSKQLIENQKQMSAALASLLGGVGPAVQQGYQAAAGEIGGLAKGFGDAQVAQGSGDAAAAAKLLDLAGAPEAAKAGVAAAAGGQGAGDVLYGTTGYIPATALEREGAAFGAAGSMLPKQATAMGIESGRQLSKEALSNDQEYAKQLAALAAKVPGLRMDMLQQVLESARADEATNIQREYLGLAGKKAQADITGFYTGPDGRLYPTADSLAAAQGAKADAAKAKGKTATAHAKSVKAREDAFATAQKSIFNDAHGLGQTVEVRDPKKPWLPPTKTVKFPEYAAAKQQLFNKYKYLLRYATRSGKTVLKKRLNQIIEEALAAQGVKPPQPIGDPRLRNYPR